MIDPEHLCPHCMKEWPDPTQPCPHCDFHGVDELTSETWNDFTIVDGTYLVGTSITQNDEGITYIAMDLLEQKVVTLRPTAEGFAVNDYTPAQPDLEVPSTAIKKTPLIPALIIGGLCVLALCVSLILHFGGDADNSNTEPETELHSDTTENSTESEATYSESTNIASTDGTRLPPNKKSRKLISLLKEHGFVGDSAEFCFQYEDSERVWEAFQNGSLDFVCDMEVAVEDGDLEPLMQYLTVLPRDTDIVEVNCEGIESEGFNGIYCNGEQTLIEITQVLFENGYYPSNSESHAVLQTFFDSYDEPEDATWCCGTELYIHFGIYGQYMELWTEHTGVGYELTYLPTGEVQHPIIPK